MFKPILPMLTVCLATQAWADGDHEPIGDAVKDLPIFDAHIHYKQPAWSEYSVASVIELMDKSGVAMGLVSSTPDEGTIMLWEYAPNRIVPELRPYHGSAGSSNWAKAEGMADYLEKRLNAYPHQGIGEFHIHRLDTSDAKLFRQIIKMARSRDIYLHVHAGTEPIRWLKSLDPRVKIIWAHAGLGTPAPEVYDLMAEFPDLLADTSLREYDILDRSGKLDLDWGKVIFAFPDRLMVGSDTWVNSQWDNYEAIIASNRAWLSVLPRDIAEQIAYKNAERVFGRTVSRSLLGTR
ncbi:putative TIM-barrel fold metal-dependent hydrolase [Shimia isoporae]|uniref:Putative TIM-barrel fold metal-dependent hydrolase n=1 Tax=Shimia isoporae TaxID=647720 RepID=A0A4R1NLY6_9RHOB|nr:amidohydrolase family protein [Shimia isoporae]TCL09135.1 putative TIM-barrel fold metal-dependent hydrolase [Shimia isoporae]